jgi:hypothetical protein
MDTVGNTAKTLRSFMRLPEQGDSLVSVQSSTHRHDAGHRVPVPRRSWIQVAIAAPIIAVELVVIGFAIAGSDGKSAGGDSAVPRPHDFPLMARGSSSYLMSRVRPDGRLVANQWVRYPRPTRVIRLKTTNPARIAGHVDLPEMTALAIWADGRRIPWEGDPSSLFARSGLSLSTPARYLHVRYLLTGVVMMSEPDVGPRGRGLVLLDAVTPGSIQGSGLVGISGRDVLSLSCRAKDALPVPCGRKEGQTWTVELPSRRRETAVFAQVELPSAGSICHMLRQTAGSFSGRGGGGIRRDACDS